MSQLHCHWFILSKLKRRYKCKISFLLLLLNRERKHFCQMRPAWCELCQIVSINSCSEIENAATCHPSDTDPYDCRPGPSPKTVQRLKQRLRLLLLQLPRPRALAACPSAAVPRPPPPRQAGNPSLSFSRRSKQTEQRHCRASPARGLRAPVPVCWVAVLRVWASCLARPHCSRTLHSLPVWARPPQGRSASPLW